jgi:hypothetical protein
MKASNRKSFHAPAPPANAPLSRMARQWRELSPSLLRRPLMARENHLAALAKAEPVTPHQRQAKRSNPRPSWPRTQRA